MGRDPGRHFRILKDLISKKQVAENGVRNITNNILPKAGQGFGIAGSKKIEKLLYWLKMWIHMFANQCAQLINSKKFRIIP